MEPAAAFFPGSLAALSMLGQPCSVLAPAVRETVREWAPAHRRRPTLRINYLHCHMLSARPPTHVGGSAALPHTPGRPPPGPAGFPKSTPSAVGCERRPKNPPAASPRQPRPRALVADSGRECGPRALTCGGCVATASPANSQGAGDMGSRLPSSGTVRPPAVPATCLVPGRQHEGDPRPLGRPPRPQSDNSVHYCSVTQRYR